jgi:tRNA U38,U39,U40 pseudouridine synthase TruA
MVSTAILATRGDLPTHTIDTALRIPFRVPMAMAPAEGLVLLEAGFMGGKINGKVALLFSIQVVVDVTICF